MATELPAFVMNLPDGQIKMRTLAHYTLADPDSVRALSERPAARRRGWNFSGLTEKETRRYSEVLDGLARFDELCDTCPGMEQCHSPYGRGHRLEGTFSAGQLDCEESLCPAGEIAARQADRAHRLRTAHLPSGTDHMTLTAFQPGRGTACALRAVSDLADGRSVHGIVLAGPPGCGKTHLASACLRRWIENGGSGMFWSVPELLDALSRKDLIDAVKRTPFLVLDDLGTEHESDLSRERLFIIANSRELAERPTVAATTCLEREVLTERLGGHSGPQIASRFRWVPMNGKDRRVHRLGTAQEDRLCGTDREAPPGR